MVVKVPVTHDLFTEDERIELGSDIRSGWDMLRAQQFERTADIIRYTVTGAGDPSRHVKPTKVLVPGLTLRDVLVQDTTKEESDRYGFRLEEGMKTFYFYDLYSPVNFGGLQLDDLIKYPDTTGDYYKPFVINNSEEENLSIAFTTKQQN